MYILIQVVFGVCSVDDNRKAKSTPAILSDIIREEGL